jgi:uncharacterized membrane protein
MPALMIVFALTAFALMGLAWPLMMRWVKPNATYGLRVAATFADEEVWYEANAKSGRDLFAMGIVGLLLALSPMFDPSMSFLVYALGNAFFIGVAGVAISIVGWLRANRLLKQRRASD